MRILFLLFRLCLDVLFEKNLFKGGGITLYVLKLKPKIQYGGFCASYLLDCNMLPF